MRGILITFWFYCVENWVHFVVQMVQVGHNQKCDAKFLWNSLLAKKKNQPSVAEKSEIDYSFIWNREWMKKHGLLSSLLTWLVDFLPIDDFCVYFTRISAYFNLIISQVSRRTVHPVAFCVLFTYFSILMKFGLKSWLTFRPNQYRLIIANILLFAHRSKQSWY